MPLIKQSKTPAVGRIGTFADSNIDESLVADSRDENSANGPSFWGDTIPAAFRQVNAAVSLSKEFNRLATVISDPGSADFDPFENLEGYEGYEDRFLNANSESQVNWIKAQINQEQLDKETIEKSGWAGTVASIAAGVVDPIAIVGGGIAGGTLRTGASILKNGIVAARGAFGGAAASELALQASLETREWGETALNISAGTFLGGILGTSAGLYKAYQTEKGINGLTEAAKKVEQELTLPKNDEIDFFGGERISLDVSDIELSAAIGEGGSVGSAIVKQAEVKLKSALGLEKLPTSPSLRTITSPSSEARLASEGLADNGLFQLKNTSGIATPESAEAFSKALIREETTRVFQVSRESFKEYAKENAAGMGQKLNYQAFKDEVGLAMKNNDIHPNKYVQKAAQENRRIINAMYDLAVEYGVLPPNLVRKTAPSYFTRVWDRTAVLEGRDELTKRIIKYFKTAQPGIDDLDAEDFAKLAIDKILGNTNRVDYTNILKLAHARGPLKELTLEIPDSWVSDFVINDVEVVMKRYINTLAPDIAIKRRFPNDNVSLSETIKKIEDEYSRLSSKIKDTDPQAAKKRRELSDRMKNDIRDITAMRDLVRGTYQVNQENILNKGLSVAEGIKQYNSLRLLGRVSLSTATDLAGVSFRHGFMNTIGDTFIPFVRNLTSIGNKMGARAKGIKEIKDLGYGNDVKAALNSILDSTTMSWEGIAPDLNATSSWTKKLLNFGSKTGQLINFNAFLNDQIRTIAAYTGMANILRSSTAKVLSKGEIERLARFGVDKKLLEKVATQFKKYGGKEKGRFYAGLENWDDREAYEGFRTAIYRMTRSSSVEYGLDIPLFMNTAWGSVFGQYKQYSFAAFQRFLMVAAQQKDMRSIGGIVSMVGLGTLGGYLSYQSAKRAMPEEPEEWLKIGVERSGILALIFDAERVISKLTDNRIGFSMFDDKIKSSYGSDVGELFLGPSVSSAKEIGKAGGLAADLIAGRQIKGYQVSALRRMIPYQNTILLSRLFDTGEDWLKSKLNVKEKKKKRR